MSDESVTKILLRDARAECAKLRVELGEARTL